jgi:hypothetical protein
MESESPTTVAVRQLTESEAKIARYNKIEREADDWGRVIGVRRLKPSESAKVRGMVADLKGFDEVPNATGEMIQIPHSMGHFIAAAVCEIDQAPIPFSRNRAELDAILDRLDDKGLFAATKALGRLGDEAITNPKDEAKNLLGTPSSV